MLILLFFHFGQLPSHSKFYHIFLINVNFVQIFAAELTLGIYAIINIILKYAEIC